MRQYTRTDILCSLISQNLNRKKTIQLKQEQQAGSEDLSAADKAKSIALMRVNHVGEVCAQALYIGQALTARDPYIRGQLQHSAQEEIAHLNWCEQRLKELNGRTSFLNPAWFIGAFSMGVGAGLAGDKISLGFLKETERQVEAHLEHHLKHALPVNDQRSRSIVKQMKLDEQRHAQTAHDLGAVSLPGMVRYMMKCAAKVMTRIAYYI